MATTLMVLRSLWVLYIMRYDEEDQMPQLEKAKVFMSGRSQAVRIPAEFRFSGSEVYIRRDPKNGDVILSQSPGSLREVLDALHKLSVPEDFLSPAERVDAQKSEDRPEL